MPLRWWQSILDAFDRKPGGAPFGIAILEPACREALGAQDRHGLERQYAVGATAVGDDLLFWAELGELTLEPVERHADGAGQMAERKLVLGPHVEDRDEA